jgi:ArsR family transcriptional regulator
MQSEAAIFRVLSDPTRLRLAVLLSLRAEICVCIMRAAGLVEARREGTWMFYRLAAARTRLEERLLGCLRECLADHPTVQSDLKRLSEAICEPKDACAFGRPDERKPASPMAEVVERAT